MQAAPDAPWDLHTQPIDQVAFHVWNKSTFPINTAKKKLAIAQGDTDTQVLIDKIWAEQLTLADVRICVGVLISKILCYTLPNIALNWDVSSFYKTLSNCCTHTDKTSYFSKLLYLDGGSGMKQIDLWFATWILF